jgi:hypothetical protein
MLDLIIRARRRTSGFTGTTAGGICSAQHGVDHGRRAPDARLHGNGVERTIPTAGATLHAGIAILDLDVPGIHLKHGVRADLHAHPAARAFLLIQFQGYDIFEISRMIHLKPPKQSNVRQSR